MQTTHFANRPKSRCNRFCPLPVTNEENGEEGHTDHEVPARCGPHSIPDEVPKERERDTDHAITDRCEPHSIPDEIPETLKIHQYVDRQMNT